ncbi:hypothetical protein OUZ56_011626 [Daphnia magna]|uniref:Uncharacterized protein n=1 Tax=Daphnia magna TaxID=35525 RepID=A0ABQ9Z0M7_9CRUS|nr:hypothetical protein OUZ56_011626 [Daphnia magna]
MSEEHHTWWTITFMIDVTCQLLLLVAPTEEDSFFTAGEYCYNKHPQTHDPVPRRPMDRTNNQDGFDTSHPVSSIGKLAPSEYDPSPKDQSGRSFTSTPLMPSIISDD